jgi:hypothetical protein
MNKVLGVLGLISSVAGTLGPVAGSFNQRFGLLLVAAGITAQTVTKPVIDLAAVWKKALGSDEKQ